jgi:DNA-binding transcriptional ArsR family regulator
MSSSASSLSDLQLDHIAGLFAALAETSRLQILRALMTEPHTVGELCDVTGLKQPNVSRQLGVLSQAKIVAGERDGNFVRYSVSDPIVKDLCHLVCEKVVRDSKALIKPRR